MSVTPLLVVRADAGPHIGTGHVMRCLALAEAWAADGGAVAFVSHCESERLRWRIRDAGHRLVDVSAVHPNPGDADRVLEIAQSHPDAVAVVDGYHFDEDYHRALKTGGIRVMVVDDYAPLKQYHADWILNQNLRAERISYPCAEDVELLLGTEYVLLRGEFTSRRGEARAAEAERDSSHSLRMTDGDRVLVTLGGADPDNVTTRVIEALAHVERDTLEVRVVVGASCAHHDAIEKAVNRAGARFHLVRDVTRMSELMAWADVAVTGGGTTCWELAFMGVPMVILVLADNQVCVTEGLAREGAAINAGWGRDLDPAQLQAIVDTLLADEARCRAMAERGRALVDGMGAERVVAALRRPR